MPGATGAFGPMQGYPAGAPVEVYPGMIGAAGLPLSLAQQAKHETGQYAKEAMQVLGSPDCNAPYGRWSEDLKACVCEAPHHGERCEEKHCDDWDGTEGGTECSGNGVCQQGKCFCLPGFGLANTSSNAANICADVVCLADCGSHGECKDGTCVCETGWQGTTCAEPKCLDDCSGHGRCLFPHPDAPAECLCQDGYAAPNCAERISEASLVGTQCRRSQAAATVTGVRGDRNHTLCRETRTAFAMKMSVGEAWRLIGVKPTASKLEIKKAFRERIRQVHPDVTGDDGTMLRKVQDAYQLLEELRDPTIYHSSVEDGVPEWASGLLQGIEWTAECSSFADFLLKPDNKALAVGEQSESTGTRPWAAAWGKFSQQDANSEALRVCRQYGVKCRLVYVGSGSGRVRTVGMDSSSADQERTWWKDQFVKGGELPGFGWMPPVDPKKEKLVGWKTITEGSEHLGEKRIRVPVFEPVKGGIPYLYSPAKPRQRIFLKRTPFKRVESLSRNMQRSRRSQLREHIMSLNQQNDGWFSASETMRNMKSSGRGEIL
ncbi:Tnr [Symbiodinium sp. CCMP2456]|nr:Tnr [Symbiodinium sp. CCMP2456]